MSSEPRLVEDMPFEDYLKHPALSASGMKHLLDSPARFQWERQNPTDTAAMSLGRLIHAIAFDQPHNYVVKDWDGRTKEGKARAAEVAEQGLEYADADDWAVAEGIAKALKDNNLARQILYPHQASHEVSAFWTDEETGVELKCRFDTLGPHFITDLKSTTKARPETFVRDAAAYGYFLGAAQYTAGAEAAGVGALKFYLVAVEKKPPHFLSVNGINDMDMELGERLRRKAIRRYVDCVERGEWPGYDAEIQYPDAPSWWRYMAEEQTGLYEIEVA